jgi:hypothetical protein
MYQPFCAPLNISARLRSNSSAVSNAVGLLSSLASKPGNNGFGGFVPFLVRDHLSQFKSSKMATLTNTEKGTVVPVSAIMVLDSALKPRKSAPT